jgi:Tol biopolymer transport system component/DNA-binding winged helix-turn-helix (wHTH) protein
VPSGRIVAFGVFEFDLETGELRSRGHDVRLQEQPRQVLRMLVARPGELVTREALRKGVWPDETFVDFEAGLNVVVNKLRHVLRDSAASPRFIETVPRRGYRFIAPIASVPVLDAVAEPREHAVDVQPSVDRPVVPPSPTHRGVGRRHLASLLTFTLVCVAATAAALYLSQVDASSPLLRAQPLTSLPGREFSPAVSPDGSRVAFLWDGGEHRTSLDLYVQAITDAAPRKLAPGSARQPAWSPDGTRIAFVRYGDRPGEPRRQEIFEVPASGGTERRLAVAGAEQFGLTWSPDGTSLAIVDKAANGAPDGIYLLSARDGTKLPLTSPPPGSIGDCLPRFSPDGRLLAFVRVRQLYLADIYVMDLRRRALTRVTREEEHVLGAPDWLQSSRTLIYSSAERRLGGIAHLWKATADGGHRQLLGDGFEPSLSRGQNPVMAYVRILIDWNVWRLPGPRAPDGAQSVRLAESTQNDGTPLYSPDGRKVAFISDRSGTSELWTSNADGSNAARLTFLNTNDPGMTAAWSSDGEHLALSAASADNADVYVVPVTGGFPKRLTHTPEDERYPSYSHDARWIYFSSRKTGSDQIWKAPSEGGPSVQVTNGGAIDSHESSDGRFLYFTKALFQVGQPGIWRKQLPDGPEEKVVDAGQAMQWALTDDGLCYVKGARSDQAFVECVEVASGAVTWSVPLQGPGHLWGSLSVSPDRRWLLMDRRDRHEGDVMVAQNFKETPGHGWGY